MSDHIDQLLEERGRSWGDASQTHARIALVWEGIGDHQPETAGLAALKMVGLKLVRAAINPDDPDSFHDAHGYLKIAEGIYGHGRPPKANKAIEYRTILSEHRYLTISNSCTCGVQALYTMFVYEDHLADELERSSK